METIATATWSNWSDGDNDSFTVCLLATDKVECNFLKLIAFHAPTGNEHTLTEVPYREDCCTACVKGNCIQKSEDCITRIMKSEVRLIRLGLSTHELMITFPLN